MARSNRERRVNIEPVRVPEKEEGGLGDAVARAGALFGEALAGAPKKTKKKPGPSVAPRAQSFSGLRPKGGPYSVDV